MGGFSAGEDSSASAMDVSADMGILRAAPCPLFSLPTKFA